MTSSKTFEMTTGPFIPEGHAQYGLLPRKSAEGGEVFSFPAELSNVEDLIREKEGDVDEEGQGKKVRLVRHDFGSYSEFFDNLAEYADRYRLSGRETGRPPRWLGQEFVTTLSAKPIEPEFMTTFSNQPMLSQL